MENDVTNKSIPKKKEIMKRSNKDKKSIEQQTNTIPFVGIQNATKNKSKVTPLEKIKNKSKPIGKNNDTKLQIKGNERKINELVKVKEENKKNEPFANQEKPKKKETNLKKDQEAKNKEGTKKTKINTPTKILESSIISKNKKTNNKEKEIKKIQVQKNDAYLNQIMQKEDMIIQTEPEKEKNNKGVINKESKSSVASSPDDTTEEDILEIDIIEQYKKKKKKELELKKRKELAERRAKLIKKVTTQNASTQVILDEFQIFYERVKREVDKITEDILNRAMKQIYEETELQKIQKEIDFYDNIRANKYSELKKNEEMNNAFFREAQEKIKERADLKNQVDIIIHKKIAHRKAQKDILQILETNVDEYILKESSSDTLEYNMDCLILPHICQLVCYSIHVSEQVTHFLLNEIIQDSVLKRVDTCEQFKRNIEKERKERLQKMLALKLNERKK